jgi:hypothetical protein
MHCVYSCTSVLNFHLFLHFNYLHLHLHLIPHSYKNRLKISEIGVRSQAGPRGIYGGQIGIRFLPLPIWFYQHSVPNFFYLSPTLNTFLDFFLWSFTSAPHVWLGQEHLYPYLLPGCVAELFAIYSIWSNHPQVLQIICTWSGLLGLSIR